MFGDLVCVSFLQYISDVRFISLHVWNDSTQTMEDLKRAHLVMPLFWLNGVLGRLEEAAAHCFLF